MTTVSAIFVQPHLDDVAWSCGGTVASEPAPLVVSVFSDGPGAGAELGLLATRAREVWGCGDRIWEIRREEDDNAAELLGAQTIRLGHLDAIYRGAPYPARESYPDATALFGAVHDSDRELVAGVSRQLIEIWERHGRVPIYLPLAVGGHVDHAICFAAGAELFARGASVWYYEDVPYVLRDERALQVRLNDIGGHYRARVVDVTDAFTRRLAAVSAYGSQLPALFRDRDPHADITAYAASVAAEPTHRAERFWARDEDGDATSTAR